MNFLFMLLICGAKWPDFDFTGRDVTKTFTILGRPILLPNTQEIDGTHTTRTAESIWDGCIVMAKFLEKNRMDLCLENNRILELGSGRGVSGLAAAVLGGIVTLTDMPVVVPELERTIKFNHLKNISVKALDWLQPTDYETMGTFDLIIAADIVWVVELIPALVNTISCLCKGETIMYLAHQTRSQIADDLFFNLVQENQFQVQIVDTLLLDPVYIKDTIHIYKIYR